MTKRFLFSFALVLFVCGVSHADFTVTGSGGVVPDFNLNSGNPGIFADTIQISNTETIESIEFCIEGLEHDHLGDLTATITYDDGSGGDPERTGRLFFRTLKAQSNGPGAAARVTGDYFFLDDPALPNQDTSQADWWAEAASVNNSDTDSVTPGEYRASGNFGGFVDLDSIFGGGTTQGDWTLRITDEHEEHVGSLDAWSIHFITAVPEPSSALILFGAGAWLLGRRKR